MSFADTVDNQINTVMNYAGNAYDEAFRYLSLINVYAKLEIDTESNRPEIDITIPGSITLDPNMMPVPSAPEDSAYPATPADPPSFSDHAFPADLVYALPSVPVVKEIVLPTFISGEISPMTTELPVFTAEVPSIAAISDTGDVSHDTLMEALKARLIRNIEDGGTMLNTDVETDLWERDKERQEQAFRDAQDRLTAQWSKLNWGLPDGLLASQLAQLQTEYLNKQLDRSREIAIKQAELEHAGVFKSMEIAVSVEKLIMDSHNEYARRALEAAKATAQITIEIFKARIDSYNSLLAAFRADAEVFKARIDAEVSRANVYKTQIEGLALVNQVNETNIKIYQGQLQGIATMADIYKTGVGAVAAKYDAEKTKIERYKTEVEAYTAKVEAITKRYAVEVEGFKAYMVGYSASSEAQTKLLDIRGRAEIASAEVALKEWEIQLEVMAKNLTIRADSTKTMSTIASNLASGALSAMHAGVSAQISGQAQLSQTGW